jgi:internalin A
VTFGDGGVTDEILRSLREAGLLHALASASRGAGARPASPAEVKALGLNSDKGVTDAGLKELKEFKNVEYLFLSGAGVTDAGLKELRDFKRLHTLDLSATAVTDAGLRELKDCKGLRTLYLRETKVTDAGVRELKAALPGCGITR